MHNRRKERQTEAITISPLLFQKSVGIIKAGGGGGLGLSRLVYAMIYRQ